MKRTLLLSCLMACIAFAAQANKVNIQVSDFQFSPNNLTVNLGDTLVWTWTNGSHTTTSTSVPSGAASWDVVLNSTSTTFIYPTTMKGSYSYKCTPHSSMGMTGTFTVIQGSASVAPVAGIGHLVAGPNPASSLVEVSLPNRCDINLMDITGKTVYQQKNASVTLTIPVADLPSGMYFLQSIGEDSRQVIRLRIQH